MDSDCKTIEQALAELDASAPKAPLLALGQTVLWDEPMKAGVALLAKRAGRRFVAGVHDTDYFAKLPHADKSLTGFKAFPHNDTTTKELWSAAAEFSSLFGGETVVRKNDFLAAGAKFEKVLKARQSALAEASEAFGWKGVVALDDDPPIAAELPLRAVFAELQSTLDWAIESSLDCLASDAKVLGEDASKTLWTKVCDAYGDVETGSLADFYRRLLPDVYAFAASQDVELETTQTSELLRFNSETAGLPRFELVDRFINPKTRAIAERAYNETLAGTEIYGLDRFGTGAIPFDLVIPGHGRGTVRIGTRGIVINARKPLFVSLKRPVTSVQELAAAIEAKFGDQCALIGKAVSLIGMLSREFVFVFHEGASGYVKHTRRFHEALDEAGIGLAFHPILRVKYSPWDALEHVHTWFKLPKPFHLAFGAEEVCAPSFSSRWRAVGDEQRNLLETLGGFRRPIDLISFLDDHVGGAWKEVAREYEELHHRLESVMRSVDEVKRYRVELYTELRGLKAKRVGLEREMGEHFRATIFEKAPSDADLAKRQSFVNAIHDVIHEVARVKNAIQENIREQESLVDQPEILEIHLRRRALELEAELKRMLLIRNAIISSRGLQRSAYRPSAWWFPLVSPDGTWFRETIHRAEAYLEPLGAPAPTNGRARGRSVSATAR